MIWSLQTLRFVAAMMIVYVHADVSAFVATGSQSDLLHRLQLIGHAGVDIFFVLSGVIIATTARGLAWREFAWRRARRILPMYLFISVPYVLAAGLKGSFDWRDAVATVLLWPATDRMTAPALPAAWTLCLEMVFYAAVTLVLIDRRLLSLVIGAFAVAMAFRARAPVLQFLGNPLIFEFMFGVALSFLPRRRAAVWCLPIGAAALLAAGFTGVAPGDRPVLDWLIGDESFRRVLIYGLPAAMIVLGAMQIDARPSVWTTLGDASYTLYLAHMLPMSLLLLVWWKAHPAAPALIIAVDSLAAVLFAWRMYARFEIPLLAWLGRRASGAGEPAVAILRGPLERAPYTKVPIAGDGREWRFELSCAAGRRRRSPTQDVVRDFETDPRA
jgi:exopolysaccharide production protein ExoZ